MALINATSLAGVLLLLYLSSFVLLAVLRIATGISIQRVGYFSIRHISFTPREGFRIDVRGIGLSLHRPTFAQPTWVSLVFTELKVTIDPTTVNNPPTKPSGFLASRFQKSEDKNHSGLRHARSHSERSRLWQKLTGVKEQIKRIHRRIRWLRTLDVSAVNSSLEVVGVGSVQVSSFTMAVHTRRKLLERTRLFRHKKDPQGDQKPAEWIFTVRNVLLGVGTREPVEVLDTLSINIHGLLYKEKEGLRDTSIAIKAGRLYVPVDDLLHFSQRSKALKKHAKQARARGPQRVPTSPLSPALEMSLEDVVTELDKPGTREAAIVQTVAESKEFFSSILRGVQEIQVGMSFIRVSKELVGLRQANLPLVANIVTHEIGIDLHRLDQSSPAHRMYFSREDVAHQALVAAVSISVSLDEDENTSTKIIYVPMATTTIRTTLPSKTMSLSQERDISERNTNILFANLVITSPSVDLVPQHLIRLLALVPPRSGRSDPDGTPHRLISRLLPKASIKFSVHEPVVRFVLPVADPSSEGPGEYDMIISTISSISLDVESSHAVTGEHLYSLASTFRIVSHQLYYQAASGVKHNLVLTDTLELKANVTASTEVVVVISGNLRTFSVLLVRNEVSKGIYNIVRHLKRNVQPEKIVDRPQTHTPAFLRQFPAWLLEFHLEGSNCSVETAGVDSSISSQARGLVFELESWTADYRSQRAEGSKSPSSKRKASNSVRQEESFANVTHLSPPTSPSKHQVHSNTDGRRLALHCRGLEGFIIEGLDNWENQPFLTMPRAELAFSTSRDLQGPLFHIHSAIRAFYLDFSLYRLYSMGVALSVLQDAFMGPARPGHKTEPQPAPKLDHLTPIHGRSPSSDAADLVSLDLKASYLRIKATLPADPPLLLQFYDISAGRHRWSAPFLRCLLARLHTESPHLKRIWARLLVLTNVRIDLRSGRKKTLTGPIDEKSIDISTELLKIAVPHGLRPYLVFDNIVNTAKSIQQLHHRFKTRTNEYILKKHPEGPKKVPRVSLRSRAVMFDIEDDPFEWKLGIIYHVGRVEQKQRLAREDAFNLKKLRLRKATEEKLQRSSSRYRNQSARARSLSPAPSTPGRGRSASRDGVKRSRSTSHRGRRGRDRSSNIRYDREGACAITTSAKVHEQEAWEKLQEHNARAWKRHIDRMVEFQRVTINKMRRMFAGTEDPPPDEHEREVCLSVPSRPGLLTVLINDLHLIIDKPTFHLHDLPKFMHEIGKGMPYDMQYSLLIPMSLSLDMGEARVLLRDYPLNLLHIPALRPGQPPRLPSWSLKTDFVIAEEFRDERSIRHVKVDIAPKGQHSGAGGDVPGFSIDVRRTVSPVKTYSQPTIDINTSLPTTISWGTSYQPVIQDLMMIIESFTKPEIDPSDRVGFWDKIRLSFHSRVTVNWKGDGDVQLRLKGSRDPYVVTGYGAGFVMCWRNDVQWLIHSGNDPRKVMTVRSGEYVLAIPDYSHEARTSPEQRGDRDGDSISSSSSQKNAAVFQKVVMKVSGNVQWTAGLVYERDTDDGGRTSNFIPHYNVVLRNPKLMEQSELTNYDAFKGFRSHHIHLSVAVAAPFDRDWISAETNPSESYNSVHLSPRFFSHFFNWWSLFSGVMSLPIRQGALWKGPEKSSKKFGRHLATIKYGLLLSPLFISHIYKHKDAEDYQEDVVSATGLKIRIDNFMLDLHQRREFFDTLSKSKSEQMRTSGMKIYRAELDFVRADLRAVAASIAGTTAEDMRKANDELLASYQDTVPSIDMSQFEIPDHDFSWIDMDDFVELDWILPAESNPETKILPLAFTPRFTYFRQTQHETSIQGDESRTSPFGDEDTHFCVMSHHNDPRKVQMSLVQNRLNEVTEKVQSHTRMMGEHEVRVVRDGDHDQKLRDVHKSLDAQRQELEGKQKFLEHGLRRLAGHSHPGEAGDETPSTNSNTARSSTDLPQKLPANHVDMDGLFSASHDEFASDFNNRFIIHNVQLKWNNALRNTILRYSHQVSQRRGFVYYMSRRAVKFILDIVDEQGRAKRDARRDHNIPATPSVISPTEERDEDTVVQDRIDQLLNDAKRFVDVKDSEGEEPAKADANLEFGEKVAENFKPMNSYHVRLIAPQIQLQSEKNNRAVVLVSAKGMQLKIVSIMDKARMSDDVSGLVQRRYALDMDGAQFFVTNQKRLAKYLHLYSGNRYGSAPGSSWPPWVSLEAMFDFHLDPFGFQRVIQKTSASLRYEKYNPLRLKYNEEVASKETDHTKKSYGSESRIDHLWVDFPRIRASCDSAQYYTMYIIVLDLLLYSEPLEKTRSERLEKIMLASDFSDLRGAPEMAERLQDRIRQLEELKLHFQIHAKYLDKAGWEDRINLEKDLASCEDELFFIMKAINTSQQRNEDRKGAQTTGFLRWYLSASEIVWHLMRDKDEPLLEFQLGNAAYERIDNSDGSNRNAIEIQRIRGWNLLKAALYPEMIGPYHDPAHRKESLHEHQSMLRVEWYMLEAIAGIPVLEAFDVNMHPLKVQLERDLAKKLFEYIFPGIGSNAFDGGSFSPFNVRSMETLKDEEDEESEQARLALIPSTYDLRISSHELQRTSSPGAMGRRLKPTYNLNYSAHRRWSAISKEKDSKAKGSGVGSEPHHHFFRHHAANSPRPGSITQPPAPIRKSSASSLRSFRKHEGSTTSLTGLGNAEEKRWGLHRTTSHERRASTKSSKGQKPTDDVSQMLSRASNYMTLAHVKLNSFVICLSYKGKSDRNLEDLHDFVFRMPTLEYANKTWSNLDLALRLKKDVIRALISHTGAIIGNKLSHHRPSKKQQDRFREIASSSTLIPNRDSLLNELNGSESNSLYSFSQEGDGFESPRMSFSTNASPMIPGTPNPNGDGQHGMATSQHGLGLAPGSLLRTGSWTGLANMSVPALAVNRDERPKTGYAVPVPRSVPQDERRASTSGLSINTGVGGGTIRPSTATSGPRSLLKDTLGRHFSGETVKGRVRFGSVRSNGEIKDKEKEKDGGESNGYGGDESDPEGNVRKSVMLLGKKVLGRLG